MLACQFIKEFNLNWIQCWNRPLKVCHVLTLHSKKTNRNNRCVRGTCRSLQAPRHSVVLPQTRRRRPWRWASPTCCATTAPPPSRGRPRLPPRPPPRSGSTPPVRTPPTVYARLVATRQLHCETADFGNNRLLLMLPIWKATSWSCRFGSGIATEFIRSIVCDRFGITARIELCSCASYTRHECVALQMGG